jgi:HAD superfamily hydrolase (TIGR01509 family)
MASTLPAAVVFDCDGLLLDTESAWTRAEEVLYRRHGSAFTLEHKRELLGTSGPRARAILERHLGMEGRGDELMVELVELVTPEVARSAPPQPGAPELVAALRAAGVPVGLASNSSRAHVDLALEVSGLAGAFDSILVAHDVARPKPAPDVYLASCAALGAPPEQAVGLEDSHTGVAAVLAAGMTCVAVPSIPGLELPEAHVIAPSLAAAEVWSALGLRLAA